MTSRHSVFEPRGIRFYDAATRREMLLDLSIGYYGWLCFRGPERQWVSQREATRDDLLKLLEQFETLGEEPKPRINLMKENTDE